MTERSNTAENEELPAKEKKPPNEEAKPLPNKATRLTKKEIEKMTVGQLTTALQERNIIPPAKALKKTLQELLLSHTTNEKEGKKDEDKRKEEDGAKGEKGGDIIAKEKLTKAEVDKMTVAQLNAALKKRKIQVPSKAGKRALQDLLLAEAGIEAKEEGTKGKRKAFTR